MVSVEINKRNKKPQHYNKDRKTIQRSVCGRCPVPGDHPGSKRLELGQYLDG